MKAMKKRLDQIVFEKGFSDSRTKAQSLIMAGNVFVDGEIKDKVGFLVEEDSDIFIKENFPYVSRGALKLEKAYKEFGLDFKDKIICDIGSSTGGFTDFALQEGAKKVFAIDVGRGQLDLKLRENPKVVVMEKTDFRNVEKFSDPVDYFVCDVSFISLKKIIPTIKKLFDKSSQAIVLIKPQFEVGKKEADRGKGVIKDENVRQKVVEDIMQFVDDSSFETLGLVESPITGAKGNVEYLLWFGL